MSLTKFEPFIRERMKRCLTVAVVCYHFGFWTTRNARIFTAQTLSFHLLWDSYLLHRCGSAMGVFVGLLFQINIETGQLPCFKSFLNFHVSCLEGFLLLLCCIHSILIFL